MSLIAFSSSPAFSSCKIGSSACIPGPVLSFLPFRSSPLPQVLLQKFLKFLFAFDMQIRLNYLEFSIFWYNRRESHPRVLLHGFCPQVFLNQILKVLRVKFIINFVYSLMLDSPRVAIFILNRIFYSYA